MATIQSLYDDAKAAYLTLARDVREIGTLMDASLKEDGKHLDVENFCCLFDCLLQYSFLYTAASDGDIASNEIVFIRDITENGDFLNYVNSNFDIEDPLTWEDIYKCDTKTLISLLNSLRPYVDKIKDSFCSIFALVDAALDDDYLARLLDGAKEMLAGLCLMDGNYSAQEKKSFENDYLVSMILDIKNKIKKFSK